MAYNTKNVKTDASGVPVPQYFDPDLDDFAPSEGSNGANKVQPVGSIPAANDITDTGNNAAADVGASVNWVDFYNAGSTIATIDNGTETRHIPPTSGRLCYFSTPTQVYNVVANGDWIATAMQ